MPRYLMQLDNSMDVIQLFNNINVLNKNHRMWKMRLENGFEKFSIHMHDENHLNY